MPLSVPSTIATSKNFHRELLLSHFGGNYFLKEDFSGNINFVFLCFTNRCGSNHFAEVLASSGYINRAEEFYNADTIIDNSIHHSLGSPAAFVNLVSNNYSKSRCFVSKIAIEQIAVFVEAGILDQVINRSTFIMLDRCDKIDQAISLIIAEQTGRWTSEQEAGATKKALRYDQDEITRVIDYLLDQQANFNRFFAINGIVPLLISYESFQKDPQRHVNEVTTSLGIGLQQINQNMLKLKKQADHINWEWRLRYLSKEQTGDLTNLNKQVSSTPKSTEHISKLRLAASG